MADRSGQSAIALMDDLRSRLANRVQLTTDGHKAYLEAVEGAFGGDADYAQLLSCYRKRRAEIQAETLPAPRQAWRGMTLRIGRWPRSLLRLQEC